MLKPLKRQRTRVTVRPYVGYIDRSIKAVCIALYCGLHCIAEAIHELQLLPSDRAG